MSRVLLWTVLLLLLAGFLTALPAAAQSGTDTIAESARQFRQEFAAAFEAKDWPTAILLGTRIADADPAGGIPAYNLACVHALSGDREAALRWLRASAAEGFARPRLVETDSDLDSIRDEPGFAEAAERIRRNHQREFDEFKRAAEAAAPLVLAPESYDPATPAPLIIALHGFGSHAGDIAAGWKTAANKADAILVAPNAIRRAGAGYSWRSLDESEWLVLRTIDRVAEQYNVDRSRIVLSGFSQGASTALILGLRQPKRFCGLIPMAGGYDPDEAVIPEIPPEEIPPIFLMVGGQDRPRQQNRQALEALEAAGIKVKLRVWPGVGHHFPPQIDRELRKALEFVCGI